MQILLVILVCSVAIEPGFGKGSYGSRGGGYYGRVFHCRTGIVCESPNNKLQMMIIMKGMSAGRDHVSTQQHWWRWRAEALLCQSGMFTLCRAPASLGETFPPARSDLRIGQSVKVLDAQGHAHYSEVIDLLDRQPNKESSPPWVH